MVVIPPGKFAIEAGRSEDESPQHRVTIPKPFALGQCEVTVGQFRRFVREKDYTTVAEQPDSVGCFAWDAAQSKFVQKKGANWRDPGYPQSEDHPVVCLALADVEAYLDWLSERTGATYRLPTEAEWEYAARARTSTARFWGQDDSSQEQCSFANGADRRAKSSFPDWTVANCDDGYVYTAPVAQFRPNPFQLYDTLGNVWEWTVDCWHPNYQDAPPDGSAWLDADQGDCSRRVVRGGSWGVIPQFLRSAGRNWVGADVAYSLLGFRVARDL